MRNNYRLPNIETTNIQDGAKQHIKMGKQGQPAWLHIKALSNVSKYAHQYYRQRHKIQKRIFLYGANNLLACYVQYIEFDTKVLYNPR